MSREQLSRVCCRVAAVVLSAALAVVGLPGLALEAAVPGSVSGRALNAAGRPIANGEVEIFQAVAGRPVGSTLHATTTDRAGAWAFDAVVAGDYVVRLTTGRQSAGVPVSLDAGMSVDGVTLIAPSAFALQEPGAAAAAQGQSPPAVNWWALGTLVGGLAAAAVGVTVLRDAS